MAGGRPRTSSPTKEELIELGEDLVKWASKKPDKGEAPRLRYCDWYTEQGFVRSQWENFKDKPEFSWYYQRAQSILATKFIDGTVNSSIAHRYLRVYDPHLKNSEDDDAIFNSKLKKEETDGAIAQVAEQLSKAIKKQKTIKD